MISVASLALIAAAAQLPVPDAPAPLEVPAPQDEEAAVPEWEGAATLGISLTEGNTDITTASATVDASKKLEKERYTLGLSWNYSEESGEVTQRKTYGKGQYDRFVSEKLYWLVQASAEADDAAGVDLRTTVGAGAGYQFADGEKWKLSGEGGLSLFNEDFEDGTGDEYLAARLAYNWAYVMSEQWSFEQVGTVFPSLEDSDDIYSRIDTRAKVTLTENMFAQAQWIWDWDNTPAEGNDRSDHLVLVTLGWSF
jgi:putative salt-induced outer membrane protein YdiY